MTDLIETLPVIALRGMTILPDMVIHFDVSRERSIKAIEEAMLKDQRTFLVTQRDHRWKPGTEDLYRHWNHCLRQADNQDASQRPSMGAAEGLERAELSQFHQEDPYLEAEVIRFEKDTELQNLPESCREAWRGIWERPSRCTARRTRKAARSWPVRYPRSRIWKSS